MRWPGFYIASIFVTVKVLPPLHDPDPYDSIGGFPPWKLESQWTCASPNVKYGLSYWCSCWSTTTLLSITTAVTLAVAFINASVGGGGALSTAARWSEDLWRYVLSVWDVWGFSYDLLLSVCFFTLGTSDSKFIHIFISNLLVCLSNVKYSDKNRKVKNCATLTLLCPFHISYLLPLFFRMLYKFLQNSFLQKLIQIMNKICTLWLKN